MSVDSVSVQEHAKRELVQYPSILTSHLVNNPYVMTPSQLTVNSPRLLFHFYLTLLGALFLMILVISAPEQWTMIPVPVKLFKLIINELGTLLESAAAGDEQEDGDSDEVW